MNFFKPLGVTVLCIFLLSCSRPSLEERIQNINELSAEGKTQEALVLLKSIVSEEIDNGNIRLRLAEAYFAQGNLAGSEKEARKAFELDSAITEARLLFIRSLFYQDKFEDVLLASENIDAKSSEVNFLEGLSLLQLNEMDKAEKLFYSKDLGQFSGAFEAHLLSRKGRLDEALALLYKNRENPDSVRLLGQINFLQGNYDEATKYFEVFTEIFPNNVRSQAYLITSLLADEQVDKANHLLNELRKPLRESALFLTFRSQIALYKGNYDLALKLSQEARAKGMESDVLKVVTSVSSFEKKNYEMAYQMLSTLEGSAKENPNVKSLLILSKSHLGYSVDGDIENYVLNNSALDEEKLNLALQLASLGDFSGAEEIKKVIDATLDSESEDIAVKSALLNSSVSGASGTLERLIELSSSNLKDPTLFLAISAKLYDSKQYGRVVELLEKKVNNSTLDKSQNVSLLSLLSSSYMSLGKFEQGEKYLSKLQEISPSSPLVFQFKFRELILNGNETEALKLSETYLNEYGFKYSVVNNLLLLPNLASKATQTEIARLYGKMKSETFQRVLFISYALSDSNADIKVIALRDGIFGSNANRLIAAKAIWELDGAREALSYFESTFVESRLSVKEYIFKVNLHEAIGALEEAYSAILEAQSHYSDRELQFQQFYFLVELARYDAARNLLQKLKLSKDEAHILQSSIDKIPQVDGLLHTNLKDRYLKLQNKESMHNWMLGELKQNGHAQMLATLNEFQEAHSDDLIAMRYLADVTILSEPKTSMGLYENLLERGIDDVEVLNNLSWLYLKMNELGRALELANAAISRSPNSPAIQSTLGAIYFELSNFDKAISFLERSVNGTSSYSKDSYLMLVKSLIKLGQKEKARKYLTLVSKKVQEVDKDIEKLWDLLD